MPAMVVNLSEYELRRARESLFSPLDAKRPTAWDQYGYSQTVTSAQLRLAYERGAAGHGAVHRILDKCWQEEPRIKRAGSEKETPWEKKLATMLRKGKFWSKLRDLDRRNLVSRFSALIYRVADGKLLSEPLEKAARLVDVIPLFEDQIKVTIWHTDQRDADSFGKPAMFQYRTRDLTVPSDRQGQPEKWEDVHPSRVQILAEGSVGDMFDGVPLLLAGFNNLVDLEKISGGSAESFLKNSSRTLKFQFDKDSSPTAITLNADGSQSGKSVADVIEEKVDKLNRSIDAAVVTQGAEVGTLQTQQSDPQPSFEVAANLFAASVRIPFTILFGQQTGRLASDEDKQDFGARCASRQKHDLTPMVTEFIERMQACGVVDAGEFEVEWPPTDTPGDAEKFAVADKMSTINQRGVQAGQGPAYAVSEIRKATGFEEKIPEDPNALPDPAAMEGDPALAGGQAAQQLPTEPMAPAQKPALRSAA